MASFAFQQKFSHMVNGVIHTKAPGLVITIISTPRTPRGVTIVGGQAKA